MSGGELGIYRLKSVEPLVYGVCLYVIGEEGMAAGAAEQALVELHGDSRLWALPPADRDKRVRQVSVAAAIRTLRGRM